MFLFLNSAYLTKFFNQTRNFTENPRKEVDMFILFLGGLCLLTGVYGYEWIDSLTYAGGGGGVELWAQ